MTDIVLSSIQQIANTIGLSTTFVKALVGLSKPIRAALRLQLTSLKTDLQAELATAAFKKQLAERKQTDINNIFSATSATFSQIKRVINSLNFGPEFNDEPEIQKLLDTLLSLAQVKGVSLGGYQDTDNIINALNFKAHQIATSIDFANNVVITINSKINTVDKYIAVLDAIDELK